MLLGTQFRSPPPAMARSRRSHVELLRPLARVYTTARLVPYLASPTETPIVLQDAKLYLKRQLLVKYVQICLIITIIYV